MSRLSGADLLTHAGSGSALGVAAPWRAIDTFEQRDEFRAARGAGTIDRRADRTRPHTRAYQATGDVKMSAPTEFSAVVIHVK